jgi:stearoyl-CoA desaturase (delta-9 desaturase)
MSRLHKIVNLVAVVVPFAATVTAVVLLWNQLVGWSDLAILVLMYLLSGLGVTVGFHRLLTHRAFDAPRPGRYALATLGSTAVQGPVIEWVADHRKHHAFADEDGDPHSPHGHGSGARAALRGLMHAHMGWLFDRHGRAERRRYAADLVDDPGMVWINRTFPLIVAAGLALPFGLGYALTGRLSGALTGLLWGGLVRVFLLQHVTWSINSVCHFFGRRRFATNDESTNVFWLALPSLGESWHHNHHAFPRSARHGLRWWELDLSGLLIAGLDRLGLARNVVAITSERQEQRRHAPVRRARPPVSRTRS